MRLMRARSCSAPGSRELARLDDAALPRAFPGRDQARGPRPLSFATCLWRSEIPAVRNWRTRLVRLLDDASPLVRAMAVWAIAQLLPPSRVRECFGRDGRRSEAGCGCQGTMEGGPVVRGHFPSSAS